LHKEGEDKKKGRLADIDCSRLAGYRLPVSGIWHPAPGNSFPIDHSPLLLPIAHCLTPFSK
jgi:uncharacterized protein (DUF2126 family)